VKYGLRLAAKSHLFRVIPALPLGKVGSLTRFVLCDLVDLVVAAFAASAVCFTFFGDVDHGASVCGSL